MRVIWLLVLFLVTWPSQAQYEYQQSNDIEVVYKGEKLRNAWGGGLNSPTFFTIPHPVSGSQLLAVYEKTDGQFHTYEITKEAEEYRFLQLYNSGIQWPSINGWVVAKDYNNDGLVDLFGYQSPSSLAVWQGLEGGAFKQVTKEIRVPNVFNPNGGEEHIYVSQILKPAVADFDGDGDVDIVNFAFGDIVLSFYKNMSQEMGYGNDSLIYKKTQRCWGFACQCDPNGTEFELDFWEEGCAFYTGTIPTDVFGQLRHGSSAFLNAHDVNGDGFIDLMVSDAESNHTIALYNQPTSGGIDSFVRQDVVFPTNNTSIDIENFPSVHFVDLDNDGVSEMIAAPFNLNGCGIFDDTTYNYLNNVWLYKGASVNNELTWELQSKAMLVDEMIDVGEFSSPAIIDVNDDGKDDLVIGNCYSYNGEGDRNFGFSLFLNEGTNETPAYTWVDDDWLGLASYNFTLVHLTSGDVNGDGRLDLVFGDYAGDIHYIEQGADSFEYKGIFTLANWQEREAKPWLYDFDEDGDADLIIGVEYGVLYLFENVILNGASNWKLISNEWGGIDAKTAENGGYAPIVPVIFQPPWANESILCLYNSSKNTVERYQNLTFTEEAQLQKTDENLMLTPLGKALTFAVFRESNDKVSFIVGNSKGGLYNIKYQSSQTTEEHSISNGWTIYPNPVSNIIYLDNLSSANNSKWTLYNINSQVVDQGGWTGTSLTIDVSKLRKGIYFLSVGNDVRKVLKN